MTSKQGGRALRWLEARLQVNEETADAVSELFNQLGTGGAVVEQLAPAGAPDGVPGELWVKAYLPVRSTEEEKVQRRRVEEGLWHLGQIQPIGAPEFRLMADEDWAETWKSNYRPLSIGRRIVIKPSWCQWQASDGQLIVELDPGQAFGTGLHPSTRLCLLELEERVQPGQTLLDLGTGSGILSIAAIKLGADRALALDIDELAVEVALDNVRANGVGDRIMVLHGTLPPRAQADYSVAQKAKELAPAGFDLMVVNILAEVIAELLGQGLMDWLAPNGIIITAGIIHEREHLVASAFERIGLQFMNRRTEGEWIALTARKVQGIPR